MEMIKAYMKEINMVWLKLSRNLQEITSNVYLEFLLTFNYYIIIRLRLHNKTVMS